MDFTLTWSGGPDAAHDSRLWRFLREVSEADGRPLVAEDPGLPRELRDGEQLLAERGGNLVGYAHLAAGGDAFGRAVAELFVRPESRGEGAGTALGRAVAARAGERDVRFWSHGDDPAAAAVAGRLGLHRVRELVRMRCDLERSVPARPELPADVRLRGFAPGSDEAAVVRVNARAFAAHPEQAGMTEADVRSDEAERWFDPAGFVLAVDAEERLLGFHWTKVHEAVVAEPSAQPVGEVYVIAVDPGAHGRGLGTALLAAGLRHLHQRGLTQAMLYVEADNTAAIGMYESAGFQRWDVDVQYAR